jgi:hypothetical protein
MNSELVFSVGMIFDTYSIDGALAKYQASNYFIPPYQRGYKWGSDPDTGAVSILLKDLREAFDAKSKEYYLQYITTQVSKPNGVQVLEVIDGQQRLTTLTLLFSVLADLTNNQGITFVKDKLQYQVRDKVTVFFSEFIYSNIELLYECSWEDFISAHPQNNEQDIYYLFHAIQLIVEVLEEMAAGDDSLYIQFADYVKEHVKIILNNVDGNISCEKIFSNLNTNKVELTSVELIKGLFLTKAAREKVSDRQPNYKEVVEVRALLGRQWDEIVAWAYQPDIRALYFKKSKSPIDELLLILGKKHGYKLDSPGTDKYALFNFFQSQIKTDKGSAFQFFKELKKIQNILQNWFAHRFIYNALGFLFFTKGSKITIRDLVPNFEKPLKEVERELKKKAFELIPDNVNELDFTESDPEIHALLLALSVFFGNDRFDFTAFGNEVWSLEHIFPQTPESLPDELQKEDLALVNSLLVIPIIEKEKLLEKYGKFNLNTYNSLKKELVKQSCELTLEEKNLLYRFIKTDKLNRMGNMALLTRGDNSSNSNGMFSKKRHNIVNRISKGSFVPKHTYDVFSKLINDKMSKDTNVWSEKDINEHQAWILTKIENLKKTILN